MENTGQFRGSTDLHLHPADMPIDLLYRIRIVKGPASDELCQSLHRMDCTEAATPRCMNFHPAIDAHEGQSLTCKCCEGIKTAFQRCTE